jgi:hypothetical protein
VEWPEGISVIVDRRIIRFAGIACVALFSGCTPYLRPVVYAPIESAHARTFFSNGQPIAVIQRRTAGMLFAVQAVDIVGVHYLRVWWLYRNGGAEPVLLEPLEDMWATATLRATGWSQDLQPEVPSRILRRIKNENAMAEIATSIGGALGQSAAAAGAGRSVARAGGDVDATHAPPPAGESGGVGRDAAARIDAQKRAYDLYAGSVNTGVLRKHTVLPGEAVSGFVYLPYRRERQSPGTNADGTMVVTLTYYGASDFDHSVIVHIGADADTVAFVPDKRE